MSEDLGRLGCWRREPERSHLGPKGSIGEKAAVLAARGVDTEPAQEGRRLARVACEFSGCIFQED